MKISVVGLHHYCLPLHAVWLSAAGDFSQRPGCLLRIATDTGRYGYGDCAPLTGIGSETLAAATSALQALAPKLVGLPVADALQALPKPSACRTPAARCALETALLDLLAQAGNVSLAGYLQGKDSRRKTSSMVAVNAALGSLMQVNEQAIRAACAEGFTVLKLKVATATVDQELPRLQRIAALLPASVRLRLDANRAWSNADATRFLRACADLPIEMVEEPLADPSTDALQQLQAACDFPLALDESLNGFDLTTLFATPPVRRLVLKPPRLGGLLPAVHLAERATAAGLQCIVTSSVDNACGVLAAAHLAAALDNDLAHGLATSSWLAADTGQPPRISNGRLALPERPGLGHIPNSNLVFSTVGQAR